MKWNIFILAILFSLLVATVLMLPSIDNVRPDPYFHIKVTPNIYWIGLSLSIIIVLVVIFSNKPKNLLRTFLGPASLTFLAVFVYVIPKLMYVTPIWTDTFLFVSEVLYTLRYGLVGLGHAQETPGLALFSSQFSLTTGISPTMIAELVPYVISLVTILYIYMVARLFLNRRAALLACLTFIAVNWIGFYFNRQSFAIMFLILTLYCMFKVISLRVVSPFRYIILLLSYVVLVISHPFASLVVVVNTFALVALILLMNLIGRHRPAMSQDNYRAKQVLLSKASQLSITLLIIWLAWQIFTYSSLDLAIRSTIEAFKQFYSMPIPTEHVGKIISGYSAEYYPIVGLRFILVIFEAITGTILALLVLFKRSKWRGIVLSSWFLSTTMLSLWGLYMYHFFDRAFYYSLAPFSVLLAWFIFGRNIKSGKVSIKIVKGSLLSALILFTFILPITMYSNTPFFFPPTVHLTEIDYITRYGNGSIAVMGGGAQIAYYVFLNNASNISMQGKYDTINITEYNVIVTGFRIFTYSAYYSFNPPLIQSINELEENLTMNPRPSFAKVYDADPWHKIYARQGNYTTP